MRGSAWLLAIPAWFIWLVAALAPLAAVVALLAGPGDDAAAPNAYRAIAPLPEIFLTTLAYAIVVACLAVLLGWLPGRALGASAGGRWFLPLAVLCLVPICLPSYAVFYAWWQSWPADSPVFAWARERDLIPVLRSGTLVLGLVAWTWPIVAWCVAGAAAARPSVRDDLLKLDGLGWPARLLDRLRTDGPALLLGGLIVAIAAFNNTTCFDLAQIHSFGSELRALESSGGTPAQVVRMAWPTMLTSAAGAAFLWFAVVRLARPTAGSPSRSSFGARAGAVLIWGATVLLPLAILMSRLGLGESLDRFLRLYGGAAGGSIASAVATGGLGALVAIGLIAQWRDHRRLVRLLAGVQTIGWIVIGLLPGTVAALALEACFNRSIQLASFALPLDDVVYFRSPILLLAGLARFGFIAALLALWIGRSEPRELADVIRADGADTLPRLPIALGPRLLAGVVASLGVVGVLAFGETITSARVQPPTGGNLALSLLNAMHYQRPETVIIILLGLLCAALIVAVSVVLAMGLLTRQRRRLKAVTPGAAAGLLLALAAIIALPGCGDAGAQTPDNQQPLAVVNTFGSSGTSLGQFAYPRCIDVDPERGHLYAIDKTARVQRWSLDGKPELEWDMPAFELGKPTGVTVGRDGTVYVADTHYQRIIAYTPDGEERFRFGSYGEGPGEFIYPTDVAIGPEGRLYVAEYGGNDRVQIFTPEGEYIDEFGTFGTERDQFHRPQSLLFNADMSELFITDAGNHRIVVVDPQGEVLRTFGEAGTDLGQLHYPYGLDWLPDGSLIVCEFGNSRLQRFTSAGQAIGLYGRLGVREGELSYPWGVACDGRRVYVLDSGSNRIQVFDAP